MVAVERLKRAVIKEEYVAITGDFQKAVLLNQFIYWSERVKDFDEFINQENKRAEQHGLSKQDLNYGWIYKTAEELSDETMLGLSCASVRSHIKALIDMGFLSERNNPKYKWDRTKQYHVNLVEIATALNSMGYSFEGYKINLPFLKNENGVKENENGDVENYNAIPEITSETPSESSLENTLKKNIDGAKRKRSAPVEKSPIDENFETLWKMLKSTQYDRKSKVSKKRKKELYEMGFERTEKAIQLYLQTQNSNYYHRRDNFLNEIIDNYLDKEITDFINNRGDNNGQNNGNNAEVEQPAWAGIWVN